MKVNKTFSIDLWILKEMTGLRNKSQFVCDAIKQKLEGPTQTIESASAKTLMIYLKNHPECDSFMQEALETSLRAAYKHSVGNK